MGDETAPNAEEAAILRLALDGPIRDGDPETWRLCVALLARGLLQRAGPASVANGWRGSPRAFVLAQDGWNRLKADRRPSAARRRG